MNQFPRVQTNDPHVNQIQQNIGQALGPLLKNPLLNGSLIKNVNLTSGSTTINHNLQGNLQGWFLVRIRGQATVWDSQDSNSSPDKTLTLNSSAAVVVDIYVY